MSEPRKDLLRPRRSLIVILVFVLLLSIWAALTSRRLSHPARFKDDLRLIDAAKDQYALDYKAPSPTPPH